MVSRTLPRLLVQCLYPKPYLASSYVFFYTLLSLISHAKQAIAISKFYLVFLSMQNFVLFLLSWTSAQYCISDTRSSRVLLTWIVLPASHTGMQMSINDSLRHATRGILATNILQCMALPIQSLNFHSMHTRYYM